MQILVATHIEINLSFTPVQTLGNQARDCEMKYWITKKTRSAWNNNLIIGEQGGLEVHEILIKHLNNNKN